MTEDPALRRIEGALAALGAEHVPPEGWESRVLAAAAARPRRRWWIVAAPAAAAAAIAIWWIWPDRRPSGDPVEVAIVIERGGEAVRTPSANLGDLLRATARGDGHCAIWIYRNDDELLLACPGANDCRASDDGLTANFRIGAIGVHSVVALCADAPVPRPRGHLDEDVAAARRAGARDKIERLSVR